MEKYPIFKLDIEKSETSYKSINEILNYLKDKIYNHEIARYIGEFDHYSHTKNVKDSEIAEEILDAKIIICCFGKSLSKPTVLSVRPRSIGVAELEDKFVITFLEAPNPIANNTMESWIKGLVSY